MKHITKLQHLRGQIAILRNEHITDVMNDPVEFEKIAIAHDAARVMATVVELAQSAHQLSADLAERLAKRPGVDEGEDERPPKRRRVSADSDQASRSVQRVQEVMLDVACGLYLHTKGDVATFMSCATARMYDDDIGPPNRIEALREQLESRGISTIGFGADPSAAQESCRPSAALQRQAYTPLPNADGITDNTQPPDSQVIGDLERQDNS